MKLNKISNLWASLAVILGLVMGLYAWSMASPVGSSPDDDYHLASIWCGGGYKPGVCEESGKVGVKLVPQGVLSSPCFAFKPDTSAACQSSVLADTFLVASDRGSFLGQYPPVYYWTMSNLVGPSIELSAVLMRLLNGLLFVLTLVALWFTVQRSLRPATYWMYAAGMVPLGIFIVASNNPSSWAVIGVSSSWLFLLTWFRSSGMRSVYAGVLFMIEVLIAAGSRTDAAIYIVLSTLCVTIYCWTRGNQYMKKLWLPLLAVATSFFFFLGATSSSAISSGLSDGSVEVALRSQASVVAYNLAQFPSLWMGEFGFWPLGWLDTVMPATVWVSTGFVAAGLIFGALRGLELRRGLLIGLTWVALAVIPIYILQKGLNRVGEQVQPRYLLPLFLFAIGLTFISFSKIELRPSTVQTAVAIALIAGANSLALYVNIKRYVSGISAGGGINLNAGAEWWWPISIGPMSMWFIGSLGIVIALLGGWLLLRTAVKDEDASSDLKVDSKNPDLIHLP